VTLLFSRGLLCFNSLYAVTAFDVLAHSPFYGNKKHNGRLRKLNEKKKYKNVTVIETNFSETEMNGGGRTILFNAAF